MNNHWIRIVALFLIAESYSNSIALAQCTDQVTIQSGSTAIGCTNVSVTKFGVADYDLVYCPFATTPYMPGYNWSSGISGTGGFVFTFTPPVSGVTLNFSGISYDPSNEEIFKLYVNGSHYAIPNAGTNNACDPMAVLTVSGDIIGCNNCGVSGWNGTSITGPISTIEVIDSLVMGSPNGSLFSLFICAGTGTGSLTHLNDDTICTGDSAHLVMNSGEPVLSVSPATGVSLPDSTHITFKPLITTAYSIIAYNSCGAHDTFDCTVRVVNPFTDSISRTICSGDSTNFGGHFISVAGTYSDTATSVWGCDSITILTLSVTPPITANISQTICTGIGYNFNGQNLTTAGSYSDTATSANGCDSITILTLSVTPPITTNISQTICTGSSYTFNGQNLTTAGSYSDTTTTTNGCDSIVALTLAIQSIKTTISSATICQGDSVIFGTQILHSAGVYSDTLADMSGCDSIVALTIYFDTIQSCNDPITFVMPTAFSPNGDNKNEVFYPVFLFPNSDGLISFTIYDRWGQLIYDNTSTGWDGTYQGQSQPEGVYTYFVAVNVPDPGHPGQTKEIHKQGTFALFR